MPPNDNRHRGGTLGGGKDYDSSNNAANVVKFPVDRQAVSPFDRLAVELIVRQGARGELDPRLLRFLAEHAVGLLT
jgi:hypothetical protein